MELPKTDSRREITPVDTATAEAVYEVANRFLDKLLVEIIDVSPAQDDYLALETKINDWLARKAIESKHPTVSKEREAIAVCFKIIIIMLMLRFCTSREEIDKIISVLDVAEWSNVMSSLYRLEPKLSDVFKDEHPLLDSVYRKLLNA